MIRKMVLAVPNRDYAARLAEYMRETEAEWETSAFTHEAALRLRLQEDAKIDLLIGAPQLLMQVDALLSGVGCVAALVEDPGQGITERVWPEIGLYQSMPSITARLRGLLSEKARPAERGCLVMTVFSAAGGAGKTTTALNLVRQAGERGLRTFYLNLESLNATARLLGTGEPDSLSRLLYSLQAEPEQFEERLRQYVRHLPHLRSDFIDAPEHPVERAAMTADLLGQLVSAIRGTGQYDLIVVDPDSGIGDWHDKLLALSDRIVWLVTDDWQCLDKTQRLLAYWSKSMMEKLSQVVFVRNKGYGPPVNGWSLPAMPAVVLPYISQWKSMAEPGSVLSAASFSGAVDRLLDVCGLESGRGEERRDGSAGVVRRGAG